MARRGDTGQYFDASPAARSKRREVELALPDVHLRLTTDAGVFAADAVDVGTKLLLLEPLALPEGSVDVLDLGCGYGPIALTIARRRPDATVWAVDVNERALELCRENARRNELGNVRVVHADAVPEDVRFSAIVSNPPIRIGKDALHALLLRSLDRLASDGRAWLVVQQHLGADSLARWLDGEGWSTTRMRSRRGYRVLEVRRA